MTADDAPLVAGITAAVLGVTDFAPHLDLFCDGLGFEVAAEGIVEAADARRLWGEGVGDVPTMLLTAAGAATGRIHLLRVEAPLAPAEHPHTLDLGLAGIDLYTRDIEASHDHLTAAGHPWGSRPATYEVPLGETVVSVTEGFCFAPDGVDVVFVQPENARGTGAWQADPGRRYTELTSVVCHVPDPDAELRFWGPDGLGMSVWYDVSFDSPGLEAMAGLPAGTTMRLAFVAGADGGTARIEVTSVAADRRGIDRRRTQRPARGLGHTGWSVRTRDLDAVLARAERAGGRLRCAAFPTSTPLHGDARLAMVDTPGGIAVEFWEPRPSAATTSSRQGTPQ